MKWEQLIKKSIEEIVAWAETQPWAISMAACQQDARWHAEGDVWTHTKRVLEQLPQLDDRPDLDRHDQVLLIFTALFHDSAKPMTQVVDAETGRISNPKHAVHGEHVARNELRRLECDLVTREAIANLVRYHGRPVFLLERDDPVAELVKMSWLLDNRLLYQ